VTDEDFIALQYVHPQLAACVVLAHRRYETLRPDRTFRVTSGLRTLAAQKALVAAGKSRTMESYHLDGLAVDLAILSRDRKQAFWTLPAYEYLNSLMQRAAAEVGCDLEWGGNWSSFKDGVHWQLMYAEPTLPRR